MAQVNSVRGAPTETTALLPEETSKLTSQDAEAAELTASRAFPLSRKVAILAGTQCAVLLGAIDMSVMAALHSSVASTFQASHESSWLATSYLGASLSFTPIYGRLSDIIGRRAANSLAISLFLIGTLGCALAPTMRWLILARFIAGCGGGGIATTSQVITADLFSVKQRGLVSAVSTGLWALGGALGGPVGGFLADAFGWRTAFMVQVPLIALSLISGLVSINYAVASSVKETPWQKLARIDFAGCGLLFLTTGSALALLSLRNSELREWSDPWVATFAASTPTFLFAFLLVEAKFAKEPILAFRIVSQRVPATVCAMATVVAVCNFGTFYSLPLWFLTVAGTSIHAAGAHLLAISAGNVIGGASAGIIIHRTGRYRTFLVLAGLLPIAAILTISFLRPNSGWVPKWLGVLPLGVGFGFLVNATNIAIMAAVPHRDIPTMTGFLWLFRSLGQLMGVALTSSILQAVLASQLTQKITGPGAKEIIYRIRQDSASINELPDSLQVIARACFQVSLRSVFLFCTAMAVLAWICAAAVPEVPLEDPPSSQKVNQEAA